APGPVDKSQADKSQAAKSQGDKSQADKSQGDKSQAKPPKGELHQLQQLTRRTTGALTLRRASKSKLKCGCNADEHVDPMDDEEKQREEDKHPEEAEDREWWNHTDAYRDAHDAKRWTDKAS